MENNKNLFVAIALSIAVLIGWNLLFPAQPAPVREAIAPPVDVGAPPASVPQATPPVAGPSTVDRASGLTAAPVESIVATVERSVEIQGEALAAGFTNRGAQMISLRVKDTIARSGDLLEMVRLRAAGPYPFALANGAGETLPVNDLLWVVESATERKVVFRYRGAEGSYSKTFSLEGEGLLGVDVTAETTTDWGLLLGPGVRNPSAEEIESRYQIRGGSWGTGDDIETLAAAKAGEPVIVLGNALQWAALEDTYFLSALVPAAPLRQAVFFPMMVREPGEDAVFEPRPVDPPEGSKDLLREYALLAQPYGNRLEATAFFGAKRYRELSQLPLEVELEKTIRWGMWSFLARPMLYALLWIHDNLVANYGWSIVLLTMVIKLLLAPLTHKSYVSSRKMQALQPKMQAIKAKYRTKKRDKQGKPNLESQRKMNEEMQALFRAEGVNPAGGCLPILLQMPVFFSFFTLLRNSVEMYNAPWALWIHDLSAHDPYYVLPLVMGASQFVQQRLVGTPGMDPRQKMMMNLMPIMFTFFFLGFPAGLVLYWLTSNLLTIIQQGVYRSLREAGVVAGDDEKATT